jgi:hypothetical protein
MDANKILRILGQLALQSAMQVHLDGMILFWSSGRH